MSFHEVRFPTNISFNSTGGPAYSTNITELDSGAKIRLARWNNALRTYNIAYGIKKKADLATVIDFYLARQGPVNGFRYKDWLDFTTGVNHTGQHSATDYQIGLGDGSTTTFQLVKKYTSGAYTKTRTITKPVEGTVLIAFDGATQESGWSVDTTTGIITFTSAPDEDVVITAGFKFDTPVIFADDKVLENMSIDSFKTGSVNSISLVELKAEDSVISDGFNYGGGKYDALSESISISVLQARVYNLAPSAADKTVSLPDTTDLITGGPYFYIINSGTESLEVLDYEGETVVALAADESCTLVLAVDDEDNKVWFAI
jgi:uncharacterized protein (TIGR02217 family)